MSPQEHFFDLLPAYALGSLDEEEQLQVSEHMAVCAICRAELQDFDQIVEDLPLAIVQSEPAGDVKNKILAFFLFLYLIIFIKNVFFLNYLFFIPVQH